MVDRRVHERLGEARLVAFVVSPFAVAVHVDDDVFAKALAEGDGETSDPDDGLEVFSVDVEDGNLEHPSDIGCVAGGARVAWVGGEADLVVDDNVDCAAGRIAVEVGKVERLGDDPLTHEGCVTVDQQWDHFFTLTVVASILFGSCTSFDHWVDELEVARVDGHGQVHHSA